MAPRTGGERADITLGKMLLSGCRESFLGENATPASSSVPFITDLNSAAVGFNVLVPSVELSFRGWRGPSRDSAGAVLEWLLPLRSPLVLDA
jgi:hypothetical protein